MRESWSRSQFDTPLRPDLGTALSGAILDFGWFRSRCLPLKLPHVSTRFSDKAYVGGTSMNKVMNSLKKIWNDESGQGATEYILLLVIVVAIALLFKDRISSIVSEKINELGGAIGSFTIQ